MAEINYITTNFSAGEISPQLEGRVDIAKYQNAGATLNNIYLKVYGGAYRRPGTYYTSMTSLSTHIVRVVPFQFSTTQAYIVEVGDEYMRFYKDNGIIVSTNPVSVTTTYDESDVFELQYAQSADTCYFTHNDYPIKKLTRSSHYLWSLAEVVPTGGPWADANTDSGAFIKVSSTSGNVIVYSSANASFVAGHSGSLFRVGNSNGYVRITGITGTSANATVIATLQSSSATGYTTNWAEGAWSVKNGFPAAVSFFEQRLYFAGTKSQPQTIWGSVPLDYENFTPGTADDDAVSYTIADNQVNVIRWLSATNVLTIGTLGGNFIMKSDTSSGPITPTNISIKKETTFGSDLILPKKIGNSVLYVQRNSRTIRELGYDFESDSQLASDATLLAEHITESGVKDMDYQESPNSTLWCVREDGILATMTRQKDQDVIGWTRQGTQGSFCSVAVIPSGEEDQVWVVTQRTRSAVTLTELDYMEYATSLSAQATYVSNDLNYDSYTKVASHFDGDDAATAYTDPARTEAYTFVGTAQLDTAQKKFGIASLLLDGNSDYVTLGDHADWAFGTSNFTIDFWVRFASVASANHCIWSQDVDVNNYIVLSINPAANIGFIWGSGGSINEINAGGGTFTVNTWHHIALIKKANTGATTDWLVTVDGVACNNSLISGAWNASIPNLAANVWIGAQNYTGTPRWFLNGWLDEFRVSNGVARWTTAFTPPTFEYSPFLQCYSEATQKSQGSYSLRVIATQTDSLNNTVTRTGASIDISGADNINFDLYSSRTGSNIRLSIHDSGGTTTTYNPTVLATSNWQAFSWDISSVADTDKDVIDQIIITITNADEDNTFYLDNVYARRRLNYKYIEYFKPFNLPFNQDDCFFVDCGLSYQNTATATSVVTGLEHLEGCTVSILGDGAVYPNAIVSNGSVSLGKSCNTIHVGLPYTSQIKTVRLEAGQVTNTTQGLIKRVYKSLVRFWRSLGCQVGDGTNMDTIYFRDSSMDCDEPPPLFTGDKSISFPSGWNKNAQVVITQSQPLPLNCLAVIAKCEISSD